MRVRLGFLPLLDAAVPIVARSRGFAAAEGIELELERETSWANVRDRLGVGHFEAAHMLAPLPIAAALGLSPFDEPLVAPMTLALAANTVNVSAALWAQLRDAGAGEDGAPRGSGDALARVCSSPHSSAEPPRFGVVHPFSGQAITLARWLREAGLDPERDVRISVLPPSLMADALAAGKIDGFCAGEPWGTLAQLLASGRRLFATCEVWPGAPDKVLCLRSDLAEREPALVAALVRACVAAARWCAQADNRDALTALLCEPAHLGLAARFVEPGLAAQLAFGDGAPRHVPGFLDFAPNAATRPNPVHAAEIHAALALAGHCDSDDSSRQRAESVWRPDLYDAALGGA